MSSLFEAIVLPEWFKEWVRFQLPAALGLDARQLTLGVLRGTFDTLLLLLLGFGVLNGGHAFMAEQYSLPRQTQNTVLKWAPIADAIAREANIPREAPLVIWFKESSMQAVNPDNCIGIMGTYDLVRSGERPCFTPGPVSDLEVARQMAIGAREFKERCPDVTYFTQDPALLKRCYFAYNAGTGAASRLDANESAYVMNNYSSAYRNMTYSDIELGTVQVEALGAWPAHLAMQSLIISQLDETERPFSVAVLDLSTRIYDWGAQHLANWFGTPQATTAMALPATRRMLDSDCLGEPRTLGRPALRPRLNPVTDSPILTQDVHGCSYGLPGLDISSSNSTAVLTAPMPGELTTYTDRWYNSTIRIENEEWIIWMLHPRSYLLEEGTVARGEPVGVMGAIGIATGPHVHYTIYDKIQETFVDPGLFIPHR